MNNDVKETIQESMLKILTIMMETNAECKDCPLTQDLARMGFEATCK